MNHFAIKQNVYAACEEMRGSSIPVFCPKPRRVGQLAGSDPFTPFRPQPCHQSDLRDKVGAELLHFCLTKGGEVAVSPPFFAGSPPTRSANPVVQDPLFIEEKPDTVSPCQTSGCALTKFGFKPAPTRVEGFDCRIQRGNESGAHRITATA